MPALVIKTGPKAGQRVELDAEMAIGRLEGDLVLEDPEVSRRHAMLRRSGGSVVVEDLESTNGTFVNEEKIENPRAVRPGDQIRVGRTTLEIEPNPRADDTIVSQPHDRVDETIVSLPVPPDQISSAEARPSREPRTDVEDATQPLPSREPRTDVKNATRPLPSRTLEAGGGPSRSTRRRLVVGLWIVLAVVLVVIAVARLAERPTKNEFASSVEDACAAVQRSDRAVDVSRTPTSGELQRALNLRLQVLGVMRALEPPEQDAELSGFVSAFVETNASITRLARSIGSDKHGVSQARESLREDLRDERQLASKAGVGECGSLGIG
ncbi:MAG TPA: FHA domain-containing protein [Actinomycetota bacterium]|nr:FHA domain-containing protein [Actinomycetota bacterium]